MTGGKYIQTKKEVICLVVPEALKVLVGRPMQSYGNSIH